MLGKRKRRDEEEENGNETHGCTLFVSNVPYDATSTDLSTAFSDLAPVRSAFVVLEHGSGVSKGVGYVSFSTREDARSAYESIAASGITINGRTVRVQWAESKPKNKDRPRTEDAARKETKKTVTPNFVQARKANDPLAIRTIVVSGLPSSINQKTLWKKLRKFDGAENVEWPAKIAGGDDPSTANVLFSSSSLAQDAVAKLHAHVFKGSLLSVTLKKRLDSLAKVAHKGPSSATAPSRASRLIVRNLPFDITEQDLRAIFLPHGPIHSIHIPLAQTRTSDVKAEDDAEPKTPRSKGFAFVWMLSKKDAEAAMEKCNGKPVVAGMASGIVSDKQKSKKQRREEKKNQTLKSEDEEDALAEKQSERTGSGAKERVIAVDWALGKDVWEKEQASREQDVEMDSPESDSGGSGGSDGEQEHLGSHEEGTDAEDAEDEGDDAGDSEHSEDEQDSEDESPKKPQLPHTDTGNTLFIRNVPFAATEDEIRTLFRAFGPLRYVRLTVDPETERPRGTGFACFWNKEDADKAIEQGEILRAETTDSQTQSAKNPFSLHSLLTPDPSAGIAKNLVLHGRTLDVVRAVTREEAAKLKEDGEKSREKADKRNLYLLREGVILPNSPAADTIAKVELEKRTNSFNARKTTLRTNPSLYVSRTRLSIRQIPLFVTERVLKRLAIHSVREFEAEVKNGVREGLSPDELAEPAVGGDGDDGETADADVVKTEHGAGSKKRKVKGERRTGVKQTKIVRQPDRVDLVTGKSRSRGYGFVEMLTHADALRVLRWANNNANVGALFDEWWKEELADLVAKEKGKERPDEARMKRMKDEMAATASKPAKGTLIVEFSIENVQVVQRRTTIQKEKMSQSRHAIRKPMLPSRIKEESPAKKRRVSTVGEERKAVKKVQIKEESPKIGKVIGSVIGRKRRARRAGKGAR